MAFVNEYISKEDGRKYRIDEINRKLIGRSPARDWTIDRDHNRYLRMIDTGVSADGSTGQVMWHFFWNGELLMVDLKSIGGGGKRGGPGWTYWKLMQIEIPQYLESRRTEILADLKEALIAYKDGGVFSANTTYSVTLDD